MGAAAIRCALESELGTMHLPKFRAASTASCLVLLACFAFAGCVTDELSQANAAKDEYENCVARNPSEPERCSHLRTEMNRRYDEYQTEAQDQHEDWREDERNRNWE